MSNGVASWPKSAKASLQENDPSCPQEHFIFSVVLKDIIRARVSYLVTCPIGLNRIWVVHRASA